jgi:hypothetical protein
MTMKIEKTVQVELDPADLAKAWAEMDAGQQAEFFSLLAAEVATWDAPFVMQMQCIADDENLTPAGRAIMQVIGEYSHNQGIY